MKTIALFLSFILITSPYVASEKTELTKKEWSQLRWYIKGYFKFPSNKNASKLDKNSIQSLIAADQIKIIDLSTFQQDKTSNKNSQLSITLSSDSENEVYILLPNFSLENLKILHLELKKYKNIASDIFIDLRDNQGDTLNNIFSAIRLFSDKNEKLHLTTDYELNRSLNTTTPSDIGQLTTPYNFYLLTSPKTDSGAISFINHLSRKHKAIVIGSNTGTNAAIKTILSLSDDKFAQIPVAYLVDSNNQALHGRGFKADINVNLESCIFENLTTLSCLNILKNAIEAFKQSN